MNLIRILAITGFLIAALVIGGCATLSEEQCAVRDGRSLGYADGMSGQLSTRLMQHREACIKYNIDVDGEAYRVGYAEGLQLYCTGPNGFEQGRQGAQYRNVCTGQQAGEFHDGYRDGRKLYGMASSLRQLSGGISSRESHITRIEQDLKDSGLVLISADATSDERKSALADTLSLAKERTRLLEEIEQMKIEHALRQQELAEFEQQLTWVAY